MKKKSIILAIIAVLIGIATGLNFYSENENKEVNEIVESTIEEVKELQENDVVEEKNEVIITDEIQEIVIDTKNSVEDLSTDEIIESSEAEEESISDEGALETDAVVEQENISYDGDNSGDGLSLLSSYQGLTYFSQADSRWANKMYSTIGDSSQTMKSSACGPTSAAMIVSSSKGTILPTTMAEIALANGYRTANNGTAWAFYPFVADYFGFQEYHTTGNFDKAMNYLSQKKANGDSKYYIIASCGSGLFTTGGHYICLMNLDGNTITVYDPYLYNGKFNTASRRKAGAVVSGNSVFVSKNSFKQYANYKNFWIFSNDSASGLKNESANSVVATTSYTRYVATKSAKLNVRDNPNGNKIGSLKKGTQVNVTNVNGEWSKINNPMHGWVSSNYLSSTVVNSATVQNISSTVGNYYRLKTKTTLYSNSNLSGTRYSYLSNTKIKVLANITNDIDYVLVIATGRKAYINNSAYTKKITITGVKNTVGNYYRLKTKTVLYSSSNLTGTKYIYLANTKVKIVRNVNSNIDYVYIPATRRYAYMKKINM